MANRWIANGSSYQTSATLGDLLSVTIQVVQKNVLWANSTGYAFSQAGSVGSNREFGLFRSGTDLSFWAGGTDNLIGNVATIFGSTTIDTPELDFELNMSTGAYTLKDDGSTVASGTASVGANRVAGMLFRIGARNNADSSSTGGAFIAANGDKFGDTQVFLSATLERDYVMPITGTNIPENENSQDGTLQAGTGGGADWESVGGGGTLEADTGSYLYVGTDSGITAQRLLEADSASYIYAGTDANFVAGAQLMADTGAYAVTGTDAGLFFDRLTNAETGTYVYSGTDANLIAGAQLLADSGSYLVSGTDVDFIVSKSIVADTGAYVVSGTDIDFLIGRSVNAESGAYAYLGTDAELIFTPGGVFFLDAETGTYTVAGTDVEFGLSQVVDLDSGAYIYAGTDASITAGETPFLSTGLFSIISSSSAAAVSSISFNGAAVISTIGGDVGIISAISSSDSATNSEMS